MSDYITLPLHVRVRVNANKEFGWSLNDDAGVLVADFGHWPVAASQEMLSLIHRMVKAVNGDAS